MCFSSGDNVKGRFNVLSLILNMDRMICFSTTFTARKRIVFNLDCSCSGKYYFILFLVKEQEASLQMLPVLI